MVACQKTEMETEEGASGYLNESYRLGREVKEKDIDKVGAYEYWHSLIMTSLNLSVVFLLCNLQRLFFLTF